MKMKKGLLLVVFLLALSSVMAAMSYTKATVTNDMSFSIENTNESLLALIASDEHNASFYTAANANYLNIDLDKGYENQDFGIQNNSTYTWDGLYAVKNNSENAVRVTVSTDPTSLAGIITYLKSGEDAWHRVNAMYGDVTGYSFVLAPNESRAIDLKLEAMHGSNKKLGVRALDLIVDAEAVQLAAQ